MSLPRVIVVTGTDTGVGKTVTTAALAAVLETRGRRVVVYKPCQTGASVGDSDVLEIERLSGVRHAEARVVLLEPMAPVAAAELDGVSLPSLAAHAERIADLSVDADHVLVEGSGGLLVELDGDGGTIADLAALTGPDTAVLVVARPALGTLNHTALTLEALERRGIAVLGTVIGSWPESPGPVESSNLRRFELSKHPLLATLPENSSRLPLALFRGEAVRWFDGLPI